MKVKWSCVLFMSASAVPTLKPVAEPSVLKMRVEAEPLQSVGFSLHAEGPHHPQGHPDVGRRNQRSVHPQIDRLPSVRGTHQQPAEELAGDVAGYLGLPATQPAAANEHGRTVVACLTSRVGEVAAVGLSFRPIAIP